MAAVAAGAHDWTAGAMAGAASGAEPATTAATVPAVATTLSDNTRRARILMPRERRTGRELARRPDGVPGTGPGRRAQASDQRGSLRSKPSGSPSPRKMPAAGEVSDRASTASTTAAAV